MYKSKHIMRTHEPFYMKHQQRRRSAGRLRRLCIDSKYFWTHARRTGWHTVIAMQNLALMSIGKAERERERERLTVYPRTLPFIVSLSSLTGYHFTQTAVALSSGLSIIIGLATGTKTRKHRDCGFIFWKCTCFEFFPIGHTAS